MAQPLWRDIGKLMKDSMIDALHIDAREGKLQGIKRCLDNGGFVDSRNCYDDTPLMIAALNGHLKVMGFLMDSNADVNAKTKKGKNILAFAIQSYSKNKEAAITLLERKGAQLGRASLHDDAAKGDVIGVERCLKQLDVNVFDRKKRTALMKAAQRSRFNVMKLLIEKGADTQLKSSFLNILCYAVVYRKSKFTEKKSLQQLLARGIYLVDETLTENLFLSLAKRARNQIKQYGKMLIDQVKTFAEDQGLKADFIKNILFFRRSAKYFRAVYY